MNAKEEILSSFFEKNGGKLKEMTLNDVLDIILSYVSLRVDFKKAGGICRWAFYGTVSIRWEGWRERYPEFAHLDSSWHVGMGESASIADRYFSDVLHMSEDKDLSAILSGEQWYKHSRSIRKWGDEKALLAVIELAQKVSRSLEERNCIAGR